MFGGARTGSTHGPPDGGSGVSSGHGGGIAELAAQSRCRHLKRGLEVSKSQHARAKSEPDETLHPALAGASAGAGLLPCSTMRIEDRAGSLATSYAREGREDSIYEAGNCRSFSTLYARVRANKWRPGCTTRFRYTTVRARARE